MINKTLVFGGERNFELDVKLDNLKNSNNRISAKKVCLKCNGTVKSLPFCENCGQVSEFKSILYDRDNNKLDIDKIKANLINPQYLVALKPLSLTDYTCLFNKPIVSYGMYNIVPSKDNEVPFSYLLNYLRNHNLIMPIDKFRYNKASFERQGYIEAYQDYLLLHILLLPSEVKDISGTQTAEVQNVEVFKKFFATKIATAIDTDTFQKLNLIKDKKVAVKTTNKNQDFLQLVRAEAEGIAEAEGEAEGEAVITASKPKKRNG